MVRVPRENSFLPVSFATLVAIAHIMTQKFVMGIPIYRQEQELNRRGIQLSRQTMYVRMYDELKCKKGDTPHDRHSIVWRNQRGHCMILCPAW